jgi:hypothetical protein
MTKAEGQRDALAYVLRMWRVSDGGRLVWRVSLQDVRSGERLGFACLDEACSFLRAQTGPELETTTGLDEPGRHPAPGRPSATREQGEPDGERR